MEMLKWVPQNCTYLINPLLLMNIQKTQAERDRNKNKEKPLYRQVEQMIRDRKKNRAKESYTDR